MSNNRKNRERPVLRNIVKSQGVARRCIITNELKINSDELRKIVDDINELIEQMNKIVPERNIPYVRIEVSQDHFNLDKTRVVLRSEMTDKMSLSNIKREYDDSKNNTFLVELYVNDNGYTEIGCTDDTKSMETKLSNFLLVDREYLSCALTDVFLDSAVFNSYSFLRDTLGPSEKKDFNKIKVEFLKDKFEDFTKINHKFYVFNNKNYKYLSFAFFSRISETESDVKGLINMWNEFILSKYPKETHIEPCVKSQLDTLVDLEQYSEKTIEDCQHLEKGSYWLLRINREPKNDHYARWLVSVFGSSELGREKVIEFSQLDPIYELIDIRYVTAFKLIVQ